MHALYVHALYLVHTEYGIIFLHYQDYTKGSENNLTNCIAPTRGPGLAGWLAPAALRGPSNPL